MIEENGNYMELGKALDLVLDLARNNIPDERDVPKEMKEEIKKYEVACDVVEDFVTNHFGEE